MDNKLDLNTMMDLLEHDMQCLTSSSISIEEPKFASVIESAFEYNCFKCIVEFFSLGYRCGYIGVNKDHPLFSKEYSDIIDELDMHIELTYSNKRYDDSDLWYFGFDHFHVSEQLDVEATAKYFPNNVDYVQYIYDRIERYDSRFFENHIHTKEECESELKELADIFKDIK